MADLDAAPPPHPQRRRGGWLSGFTGLLPVLSALPVLLLHLWALGIALTLSVGALVVGYHPRKGQGVTALDLASLGFGLANAALYFGIGITQVLEHLDTTIYALLFLQMPCRQLVRAEPWTTQLAKRTVGQELWETAAFRGANRSIARVWGGCFLVCALASVSAPVPLAKTVMPAAVLIAAVVATPRLARRYGQRRGSSRDSPG